MDSWTISMDTLDIVQSFHSNTLAGQCPWKMSTETMDFLQTGYVYLLLANVHNIRIPCYKDITLHIFFSADW